MDQETKDSIIGNFMSILMISSILLFIYIFITHIPPDDSLLPPKDHYTYYIDMDSHSKLDEYLINDKDIREAFKSWSDLNDDISFTEVDETTDDYKMAWIHRRLGTEPQLPDIIIFFSQTPNTYGIAGHTRCYITYCTIEMSMGLHDCNNDYRLYDYNYLLKVLKHEIGHTIGIYHTSDRENLMYSGYEIGHNKAIDNFNPRNLTIPDHKYLIEFKDYAYVISQAQQRVYVEGTVDIPKIMRCFYTPPFLSYDWFSFEFRKILR